ncbi:MAG TPA: hypothetical protein VGH28_28755 [Polyangiaceae bacterium]|jgi:hypothetical protein
MNPEETPLLKRTLRMTALMVVPVIALLAILSAVALFAVPSSSPSPKEQRVVLPGDKTNAHGAARVETRRDGT